MNNYVMGCSCSTNGPKRHEHGVVLGKLKGNVSLERYTCGCEVSGGGWEESVWFNLAKIRDT
jgi:hypothetical protein